MKFKCLSAALMLLATASAFAYKPVGDKIQTRWAKTVTPENVWPEYPRPIMERPEWKNLNGLWDYAIVPLNSRAAFKSQGEILVPFCVESSLSGVGKNVGKDQALWYQRTFTVPAAWKGQDVLLNFGAVDWKCSVWVNDILVGTHTGGYTPFSLNITAALKAKGDNTLTVRVIDPTDSGTQPRGKQVNRPNGIWYTPVTGIWQTVWLEPVSKQHIANIKTTPDIDLGIITVEVDPACKAQPVRSEVKVLENGNVIASASSLGNQPVEVAMPENFKLWTPDTPNIYDLEVVLYGPDGKQLDKVKSYTAMRKFSTARDNKGIVRMQLNNKDLFQFGPLDQGWWPDGLYTAPSYEAMIFDLEKTKELGFNMIRKHVKVEPATWYTWCDKNGMIVWQDMPNGDKEPEWQTTQYFDGTELHRTAASEANYRQEWKDIMDANYNYPSIGVWVPFNERWGQFKTVEISDWTKAYDSTRLVNPASGGNFYLTGDILDNHHYPHPTMAMFDGARANVLGEYGGIGYPVQGHLWQNDKNWGYVKYNSPKEVTDEYVKFIGMLRDLVPAGYCAGVYTQTTDVEGEVNGIYTYDREILKMDADRVKAANQSLTHSLPAK